MSTSGGDDPSVTWDIRIAEVVNGEKVEHTMADWGAIRPILKQLADSGSKSVQVSFAASYDVTRLEANQIVNDCKRAGFPAIEYHGPTLFLGRADDSWKADANEVSSAHFDAGFRNSDGYLPDWTNGWMVLDKTFVHFGETKPARNEAMDRSIRKVGGKRGPAAELLESWDAKKRFVEMKEASPSKPPPLSEMSKQIDMRQRSGQGPKTTVELVNGQNNRPQLRILQQFPRGETTASTYGVNAFAPLVQRVARFAGQRIDVRIDHVDSKQNGNTSYMVNPLHVNTVLNACRRAGLAEVHYWGQKIVTGAEHEYSFPNMTGQSDSLPFVKFVLSLRELEGDLPDESNGWITMPVSNRVYVLKAENREKLLERLSPKPEGLEAKVAQLAKLSPEELAKVLAKEPSLLRERLRKSVEDYKAKHRGR
jgi:hypothetical protein